MSDDLPERIRLNAEAVRIALSADSVARITRTVTPVLERLAAEKLAVPMDIEPSTFTVIQRREIAE
jgi:hypothetical protein